MKINIGDSFKCKKDVYLDGIEHVFIKGNIYYCELENCLTNELNQKDHIIIDEFDSDGIWLQNHFVKSKSVKDSDVSIF